MSIRISSPAHNRSSTIPTHNQCWVPHLPPHLPKTHSPAKVAHAAQPAPPLACARNPPLTTQPKPARQAYQTRNGTNQPHHAPIMRPHQQAPPAKYKHLLPSTSSPKGVAPTPAPSSPPPLLLGATHPLPRSLDRPPRLRRNWSSSVAPINRHRRRNGPFRSPICVVVIVVIVVATKTPRRQVARPFSSGAGRRQ